MQWFFLQPGIDLHVIYFRKCLSVEYKCANSPVELTQTIPDSENPVIEIDSVNNFSVHTVRLKLGIIFRYEMPTFPAGQITSVSPTTSGGGDKIFSGTARNSHFSGEILLAGKS